MRLVIFCFDKRIFDDNEEESPGKKDVHFIGVDSWEHDGQPAGVFESRLVDARIG